MNEIIIDTIKDEKGVVDIDVFIKTIHKGILKFIPCVGSTSNYMQVIEFYVLYYLSMQDLKKFSYADLFIIANYTGKCLCRNPLSVMKLNSRDKYDVLLELVEESSEIYYDDYFDEIYKSSSEFREVIDEISFVESGRLPESSLERFSEKTFMRVLKDVYKIVFNNKLN